MIARVKGRIQEKKSASLLIDVGGICYEVFLPSAVMQRIDESVNESGEINLITYHYFQVEPSKSVPILIGFLNEVERDFFQAFISVSGIGPRAALKAINKPISLIAQAIDEADLNFLKTLPGIGQQKARDIIAKLQNKVGRFGLIQDDKVKPSEDKQSDIVNEALDVLTQLEYKKQEAMSMIKKAMDRESSISTTEELLNEVYKQKRLR